MSVVLWLKAIVCTCIYPIGSHIVKANPPINSFHSAISWSCLTLVFQVLSRIYNYSIEHLTANCDSNYLAFYDMSTASSDVQQKECRSVYLPYISKNWRTIVRLHAHSIRTLPEFRLLGNIYWPSKYPLTLCTHMCSPYVL